MGEKTIEVEQKAIGYTGSTFTENKHMSCSCNSSSTYATVQPPVPMVSSSPCACQGVASRVASAQPSYRVSPIVTTGTVVIPRRCTTVMVSPIATSTVMTASVVNRGCGCR